MEDPEEEQGIFSEDGGVFLDDQILDRKDFDPCFFCSKIVYEMGTRRSWPED